MRVFATDLDGCVADIEDELEKRIINKFNIQPKDEKRLEYYMHDRFEVAKDVMEEFISGSECFGDPEFWLAAKPITENIMEMQKWVLDYGCVPSIITARHPGERIATEAWLAKCNVPYSNALFGTKNNKHLAVRWTCSDFMVEDRWEEALSIYYETTATSYVYATAYNEKHRADYDYAVRKKYINPDRMIWVESYKEITEREFGAKG